MEGRYLPHRGRVMELPGSIMPGKWEAIVANDDDAPSREEDARGGGDDGGLRSLRISLRHVSATSSPLESHYRGGGGGGNAAPPRGTIVSLVDPSADRVSSFVKQGIFTDDEIDFSVEGGEKMSGDSSLYLSCVSLVAFGGFSSASEATNDAEGRSRAMLSRCAARPDDNRRTAGRNAALREIVGGGGGKDSDDVTGILFPCKIDFEYEYSLLISHDDRFRVDAIDGKYFIIFACFIAVFEIFV